MDKVVKRYCDAVLTHLAGDPLEPPQGPLEGPRTTL